MIVALALGSNLGESVQILQGALGDLAATGGLTLTAVSAVFETDPVGGPEQGAYLNAVVLGRWSYDVPALLAATQAVEQAWHRERTVRWGPRTLDIDILRLGDHVVDTEILTIPHPRAHERAFVLVPWLDVDAAASIPGKGAVADLLDGVDASGVRRTDVVLRLPAAGEVPWTR